jgi:hypothetical protein
MIEEMSLVDRQTLAKILAEIRALEDEPDKTKCLSAFSCSVADRLAFLKSQIPEMEPLAEANPAMAPANVAHESKPQTHSGTQDYAINPGKVAQDAGLPKWKNEYIPNPFSFRRHPTPPRPAIPIEPNGRPYPNLDLGERSVMNESIAAIKFPQEEEKKDEPPSGVQQ